MQRETNIPTNTNVIKNPVPKIFAKLLVFLIIPSSSPFSGFSYVSGTAYLTSYFQYGVPIFSFRLQNTCFELMFVLYQNVRSESRVFSKKLPHLRLYRRYGSFYMPLFIDTHKSLYNFCTLCTVCFFLRIEFSIISLDQSCLNCPYHSSLCKLRDLISIREVFRIR